MSLHPRIVGRSESDPLGKPTCVHCGKEFKGGKKGDPGVNVYSSDGMREIAISGMCETCFDEVTAEPEEETTMEDEQRADGGPAFARASNGAPGHEGMSVRDLFAAYALQGLLSDLPKTLYGLDWETTTAKQAYRLANAMLRAREAK